MSAETGDRGAGSEAPPAGGGGKTSTKRRHDKAMQIRMTAELLELIHRASASAGLGTSGWVRDRLARIARRELRASGDETPRGAYRDRPGG